MPAEGYQWREDEFLYGDATSALRAAKEDAEWTALLCGHAVDGAFDDDTANRELAGHFRRLGYETIRFTFADDASAVGGAARAELLDAHVDAISDVYDGSRADLARLAEDPGRTVRRSTTERESPLRDARWSCHGHALEEDGDRTPTLQKVSEEGLRRTTSRQVPRRGLFLRLRGAAEVALRE